MPVWSANMKLSALVPAICVLDGVMAPKASVGTIARDAASKPTFFDEYI
jgi:hypothetical protein